MPVTILGREYQYGLMPDGKWWLTENLIAHGSGPRYAADHITNPSLRAALDEYGALYLPPEVAALSLGIWRLPTPSEWLTLVAYATSPLDLKKTATGDWSDGGAPWLTPNSGALGSFGMDLVGAGTYLDEFWQSDVGLVGTYLAADGTFYYLSNSTGYGPQAADATRRSSIRLVSDVDPALPPAADPVLSVASGYSAGPVTVAATCATPGAVLRYTVDGSTPTESSPVLNGGIRLGSWISPAITLKVIATATGYTPSSVVSATYQFTAQAPMASLQMQPETGYFFSEADSRRPRSFGASGKSIFKGTIQWDLIDDEWPMFLEWWEAKAKGVTAFDIYCCTGAAAALHTFQALGPYSVVTETGLRKVTLPVKLTNRPTGLTEGWGDSLLGPPATYPSTLQQPQWGYQGEEAAMFLSTSGMPATARPVATRGETLAFEWKGLTGAEFDVLVDWWASVLGRGRRKFQLALPNRDDTLLCQLVEDPSFTVDGVYFSGSLKVFASKVRTLAPIPS